MKKFLCAVLIVSTPAFSAGFDIEVENFTARRGIAEAVLKVTNNTGAEARRVFIDCVFLDRNKRAIDIGKASIEYIGPGDYAYDKASIPQSEGVKFVECDVKRSR